MRRIISLLIFATLILASVQAALACGDDDYYSAWVEEVEITTVIQNRRPVALGMSDGSFEADGSRLYVWLDLYIEEADYMDVEVILENAQTGERLTLAVPGPADSEFDWGQYQTWVQLDLTPDRAGNWKVSVSTDGWTDIGQSSSFVATAPPAEIQVELTDDGPAVTPTPAAEEPSLWVQFIRS